MTTSPSDRADQAPVGAGAEIAGIADIAVIGAGPAGLSAAVAAADVGATVALVDSESAVGGQFWRHPASAEVPGGVTEREVAPLHHDVRRYRRLRRRLAAHMAAGTVTHLARHEVWAVQQQESAFVVKAVTEGPDGRRPVSLRVRSLVLATGAYDLQLPFPGWDLPGVMTAGGAQSLLKGHGVLAGRRAVVAGTGPFLLSVASGLARSGATVPGVFEAASPRQWLREPRAVLAAGSKLLEGAGYAADLLRHRIGYRTGWTVLAAGGGDRLDSVTVAPLGASGKPVTARAETLRVDVLAVGWGFVPRLDLPLALGCGTIAGGDGQPVVEVDIDQRSTVPGVFAAGEICGVGGAALAAAEGEIAGIAAARDLSRRPAERQRSERVGAPARDRLRRRRSALREFAAALQRTYPVPDSWIGELPDDTVVCRCEEVSAGAIREAAARNGIADARSAKLLARPGMGWCQGRICGYATECLVAAASGSTPDHRPDERAIATPVPLGLVARRT